MRNEFQGTVVCHEKNVIWEEKVKTACHSFVLFSDVKRHKMTKQGKNPSTDSNVY